MQNTAEKIAQDLAHIARLDEEIAQLQDPVFLWRRTWDVFGALLARYGITPPDSTPDA